MEEEVIIEYDYIKICKQLNNPYGNGFNKYYKDKFIGSWDTIEQIFNILE